MPKQQAMFCERGRVGIQNSMQPEPGESRGILEREMPVAFLKTMEQKIKFPWQKKRAKQKELWCKPCKGKGVITYTNFRFQVVTVKCPICGGTGLG